MTESIYFVWTVWNGKPFAQKRYGKKLDARTGKELSVAFSHLLTEQEHNLTLHELCEKYPYVKPEQNDAQGN